MDITRCTVEQLEALCFRLIEQHDTVQQNLNLVQQELDEKRQAVREQLEPGRDATGEDKEAEL